MSQLPEVEVLRRDLEKEIVGKKFKDVWASPAELVKRFGTIKAFAAELSDCKITGLQRRGRALLIHLDSERVLVIIPGTRARITKETAKAARRDDTRMTATFTAGGSIHYADVDGDGSMTIVDADDLDSVEELQGLGADLLAEPIPWPVLGQALASRDNKLKLILTDDTFVVGLGDIYSDEILFEAGLSPDRNSASLSSQEVRRLHRALLEVVHEAIKQGGVNAQPDDGDYTFTPYEEVGFLKIYGREGEPDARSRQPIARAQIAKGVWSYYSPKTQT